MHSSMRIKFIPIMWCLASVPAVDALAQPIDPCAVEQNETYRLSFEDGTSIITDPKATAIVLPGRNSAPGNQSVHALVQLCEGVSRHDFADIGVVLLSRFQATTYMAAIPRQLAERLARAGNVDELSSNDSERTAAGQIRWIGTRAPELKMSTALRTGRISQRGLNPDGTLRLRVRFYLEVTRDQAEAVLASVTDRSEEFDQITDTVWHVNLHRSELATLLSEDFVRSVDQAPPRFTPTNDLARGVVGVDAIQAGSTPPNYVGLTGDGVTVAVMDNTVDISHDDFWNHDSLGHKVHDRFKHHNGGQVRAHGTHVAGIIGGNGFQSNRSTSSTYANPAPVANGGMAYQWRGMAPRVDFASFEILENTVGKLQDFDEAFRVFGAGVSNNSYVQNCTDYDLTAETIDELIHGDAKLNGVSVPARTLVWSAGNNGIFTKACDYTLLIGYFSILASAKNPIVVGGVNTDHSLYMQSSLGPTPDSRLKPDVVAPSCLTSSVTEDFPEFLDARSNGYLEICGTSQATAVVSGIVALLLEQWKQSFGASPKCGFGVSNICFPLPSTIKAALVQSAIDLIGSEFFGNIDTTSCTGNSCISNPVSYDQGPDYVTGYGLVDADSARLLISNSFQSKRLLLESDIASKTEVDKYYLDIPDGASGIRVTLAWDDEPANPDLPEIDPKLVNDLNLVLIDPNDKVFGPWVLPIIEPAKDATGDHDHLAAEQIDPATLFAQRVDAGGNPKTDHRNNVEQVEIDAADAIPGPWTVRVKVANSPDDPQQYSLAANFPFSIVSQQVAAEVASAFYGRPETRCVELDWSQSTDRSSIDVLPPAACAYLPMEPICRYILSCPLCDDSGYCAGMQFSLIGLPPSLRVEVRNEQGDLVTFDEPVGTSSVLTWRPEVSKSYGIYLFPDAETISQDSYTVGLEIAEVEL